MRRFTPALAVLASVALTSVALAQPAPTATPNRSRATPAVLDGATGLDSENSRAPFGLDAPSPEKVADYLKAVSSIEVVTEFKSNRDSKLGPVEIKNGADLKLTGRYSKKDGQDSATLDRITIEGSGVKAGPLGLVSFHKAEVLANGEIRVKLNKWLPELKIKKVEKQPNGDVKLKGSWWMPDVTITKDGDVKVGKLGLMKTVGHLDVNVFANWPPSLQDFMALAAAPRAPSDPNKPNPLTQLGGSVKYDVKGTADGLPIDIEGKALKAKANLELHGEGQLANGKFETIGDKNTVHAVIDFGGQKFGTDQYGATVKSGVATIDGKYRLSIPLKDAKNAMVVEFDGNAAYKGVAGDIYATLPNGGKVTIAEAEVGRDGGIHFKMNGTKRSFRMDDSRYTAAVRGPIKLEKLGPIESLVLDGELASKGIAKVRADGLVMLNGDLTGDLEVSDSNGFANLLDADGAKVTTRIKKGSKVRLDLNKVAAALNVPFTGLANGEKPEFLGADVAGKASAHLGLEGTKVTAGGATVDAPAASLDLGLDGRVKVRGTEISGRGTVTGDARLDAPATVNVGAGPAKIRTTLDAGSHVGLTANVSGERNPANSGSTATVAATKLNARTGPALNAPIVRVLDKGEKLKVVKRAPGSSWAEVEASNGQRFFVNADYLTLGNGKPALTVDGKINGELGATNVEVKAGELDARVNGRAKVGIEAPFAATAGAGGVKIDPAKTKARIPVRIDLKKGTRIAYTKPGAETTVQLDTDGSYIQLVGDIALGPDGKPALRELKDVDVRLAIGKASAKLLGRSFDLPVEKEITFKGRVVFRAGGIDVYGDFALAIRGGNSGTPIFRIDF